MGYHGCSVGRRLARLRSISSGQTPVAARCVTQRGCHAMSCHAMSGQQRASCRVPPPPPLSLILLGCKAIWTAANGPREDPKIPKCCASCSVHSAKHQETFCFAANSLHDSHAALYCIACTVLSFRASSVGSESGPRPSSERAPLTSRPPATQATNCPATYSAVSYLDGRMRCKPQQTGHSLGTEDLLRSWLRVVPKVH